MLAQRDLADLFPVRGVVQIHASIRPTGHEKRLAVGMKQDSIRTPAGLESIHHAAGLKIDHHDGIVIKVRCIEAGAIGRNGNVADEVSVRALCLRSDNQFARAVSARPCEKVKSKTRSLRSAADVDMLTIRRKRESQPRIRDRDARNDMRCASVVTTLTEGGL